MKQQRTLSIGVDVSKNKLDVCLLGEQKAKYLQADNNQKGILSLAKKLKACQVVEDIPIVIESTGGYHYGITFGLQRKAFRRVLVINPIITREFSKRKIRKTKTDKTDAHLLAEIGIFDKELKPFNESEQEIKNKKKVKLIHFLDKELQRIRNKIASLDNTFVKESFERKILKQTKEFLELQIKKTKEEIVKSTKLNFSKIQGVSDFTAKAIAIELGNVTRFNNRKQVAAFAGLDPSIKESGSSVKGRSSISKRGSKTIRYFLFQAAWGVMMHNNKYQEYYQKKKKEGKHYFTCLTAISRKLLLEIFHKSKEQSYCNN